MGLYNNVLFNKTSERSSIIPLNPRIIYESVVLHKKTRRGYSGLELQIRFEIVHGCVRRDTDNQDLYFITPDDQINFW